MPDARVQSAIDHWAPRFVQGGVDINDFRSTTAGIERWEDWLDGWRALGDEHAERARDAEASARRVTAGEAWLRAAVAYHFGKFVWVLDADRAREVADLAVEALYAAHRHLDPTAERIEAPLDGGRRRRQPAPARARRAAAAGDRHPRPGLHQGGVLHARGGLPAPRDGDAVARRPGPGRGGYELPIRPDYEVAVAAALDILDGREDLDLDRVGALGVSLGGYHAPRAAAFEPRIRAVAGISGAAQLRRAVGPPPRAHARDVHAQVRRERRRPGARAGAAARPGRRRRAARRAGAVRHRQARPPDPLGVDRAGGEAAPQGEFVLLEQGNHVCANLSYMYRPLVADWLRDRLG